MREEVLLANDLASTDAALTGGKGSSLAILNALAGVTVPDFFCVSTVAFKNVLQTNPYALDLLQKLQALSDDEGLEARSRLLALFEIAAQMRDAILAIELPAATRERLEAAYRQLAHEGEADVPTAVRSSATTEDTADASFAGQHDTFLNQRGAADVLLSIRRCWASIFTDRAVEYRTKTRTQHGEAVMSVVVQRMVEPVNDF